MAVLPMLLAKTTPPACAKAPVPCATARLRLPSVTASAFLPPAYARLSAPDEMATVTSVAPLPMPFAMAPVNSPLAVAVVLGPIPTAKLVGLLVQPPPSPIPLIDTQVAFAVPAEPSAAAANPDAAAPSSTPPASFSLEVARCLPDCRAGNQPWVPSPPTQPRLIRQRKAAVRRVSGC